MAQHISHTSHIFSTFLILAFFSSIVVYSPLLLSLSLPLHKVRVKFRVCFKRPLAWHHIHPWDIQIDRISVEVRFHDWPESS